MGRWETKTKAGKVDGMSGGKVGVGGVEGDSRNGEKDLR